MTIKKIIKTRSLLRSAEITFTVFYFLRSVNIHQEAAIHIRKFRRSSQGLHLMELRKMLNILVTQIIAINKFTQVRIEKLYKTTFSKY